MWPQARTVNGKRLGARLLLCFALAVFADRPTAAAESLETGAAVRHLEWNEAAGTLAASQTLGGVTFIDGIAGPGARASIERHPEWPTISAEAIGRDAFLLADRFDGFRLVRRPEVGAPFAAHALWPCESIVNNLLLDGDTLYVAAGSAGLLVYEWADRDSAPKLRARMPYVDFSKEVRRFGVDGVALADNFDNGLQILTMRDIERPMVNHIEQLDFVDSVACFGNEIAFTRRKQGTIVLDATDRNKPAGLSGFAVLDDGSAPVVASVEYDGDGNLLIVENSGARFLRRENGKLLETGRFRSPHSERLLDGIFLGGSSVALASDTGRIVILQRSDFTPHRGN